MVEHLLGRLPQQTPCISLKALCCSSLSANLGSWHQLVFSLWRHQQLPYETKASRHASVMVFDYLCATAAEKWSDTFVVLVLSTLMAVRRVAEDSQEILFRRFWQEISDENIEVMLSNFERLLGIQHKGSFRGNLRYNSIDFGLRGECQEAVSTVFGRTPVGVIVKTRRGQLDQDWVPLHVLTSLLDVQFVHPRFQVAAP